LYQGFVQARDVSKKSRMASSSAAAKRSDMIMMGELLNVTCTICAAGSYSPELECF